MANLIKLRTLAKEHGIATDGLDASGISRKLLDLGIEHDVPAEVAKELLARINAVKPAENAAQTSSPSLTETKKRGNNSWQPARVLDVSGRQAGFRYRWCDRDAANIDKKLAEGWVMVDGTSKLPGEHMARKSPDDGKPLDSTKTYREYVLMALPEERGQARDAWVAERTRNQTIGLKKEATRANAVAAAQSGVAPAALHGKIVIE